MDLSVFKASASNVAAFCQFSGPDGPIFTDAGQPVGVWLLGQDSDVVTKLLNQQTDRYLKARVPGAGVSAAAARSNEIELLAQATVKSGKDWQGIAFDGEQWPCDEDHARQLYKEVPTFREQAARFMADRGNWQTASQTT